MTEDAGIEFGPTIRSFAPGMRVFGRFVLARVLGRGGMGVVWLARDEVLELDIALKFLPEAVGMDEAAVADLTHETRRSRELAHHHIVRVYDFHRDERLAGISMEWVDGETLTGRRLQQPNHVFEPPPLAAWARQLAEALDYAHQRVGVVHRDLKPSNLLVNRRGELKVADFGISASVSESVTRVSRVVSSSGSPPYMSPQQMLGERPTPADDIYGFGATLYELLTGKPPFHSGNIVLQVQSKVPPSVALRREELGLPAGEIPEAWERTIAACLAKDAAQRPRTAGAVVAALEAPAAVAPPPLAVSPPPLAGGVITRAATAAAGPPPEKSEAEREERPAMPPREAADEAPEAKREERPPGSPPASVGEAPEAGESAPRPAESVEAPPPAARPGSEPPPREAPAKPEEAAPAAAGPPPIPATDRPETSAAASAAADAARSRSGMEPPASSPAPATSPPAPPPPATRRRGRRVAAWTVVLLLVGAGLAYLFGIYLPEEKRRREVIARENQALFERIMRESARGRLTVDSTPPGAAVEVAGQSGKTPARFDDMPAGRQSVTVRLDGYEDWHGEVDVKGSETAAVSAPLERSTGSLEVRSEPRSLPFVVTGQGRTERGKTPATVSGLPTGPYQVVVTYPGLPEQEFAVTVGRQQTAPVLAEFEAGVLAFASTPPGALVRVTGAGLTNGTFRDDNGHEAVTPFSGRLLPGAYDVEFSLAGHESVVKKASVGVRTTTEVAAVLPEERPGPRVGEDWVVPDLGVEMVWVAPGTFTMGSPPDEPNRSGDEGPQTRVTLSDGFWLGRHEVTQEQWKQLTGESPSRFGHAGGFAPVENVSWADADRFCRRLTDRERAAGRLPPDLAYALPTEAQWEYACRAGTGTALYTGGLTIRGAYDGPELDPIAWYGGNSNAFYEGAIDSSKWEGKQYDHKRAGTQWVGMKQANAWGFHDMIGNVWEWTDTWLGDHPGGSVADYRGPASGTKRVIRGGGWFDEARHCRAAHRHGGDPEGRGNGVGLRLALVRRAEEGPSFGDNPFETSGKGGSPRAEPAGGGK